ncbi:hypothetical protein PsorP6_008356 [Peronosclerospora sorghi]|uniref:Uncharacterized protein n=1 Tax=Peronosclerospora sorghi TaxID=230839 RepID=A0ACC0W7J0_9STRA|nr:hypothetical protein PsorP6_008356 [Peronosclerospora sorghi]
MSMTLLLPSHGCTGMLRRWYYGAMKKVVFKNLIMLAHYSQFGGDPNQLVLLGHSAGAHLVMQVLADPQYLVAAGMNQSTHTFVKGAVGLSGVYNIVRLANTAFYGPVVTIPPFGNRVEQWRNASIAMTVLRVGSISPILKIPLLLLNARDDLHLVDDSKELTRWLIEAGSTNIQRHVITNCNHFSIIQQLAGEHSVNNLTMKLIMAFIKDIPEPNTNPKTSSLS